MEFSFEARVVVKMDHKEGSDYSTHLSTDFNLYPGGNLEKKIYIDEENFPTQQGSVAMSIALVQGLVGNIHFAHQKGFRDSAEHLRWIIAELERGFVSVVDVKESTFDK